jgi:Na+-transporting methylmalonyl-CoA/oxaloacetate decarboxylase gamma subunit
MKIVLSLLLILALVKIYFVSQLPQQVKKENNDFKEEKSIPTNYYISQKFIKNDKEIKVKKVKINSKKLKELKKFKLKAIIKSDLGSDFILLKDKKKTKMLSVDEEYKGYKLVEIQEIYAIFYKKSQNYKIILEKNKNADLEPTSLESLEEEHVQEDVDIQNGEVQMGGSPVMDAPPPMPVYPEMDRPQRPGL